MYILVLYCVILAGGIFISIFADYGKIPKSMGTKSVDRYKVLLVFSMAAVNKVINQQTL